MVLYIQEGAEIENPRQYASEAVEQLRSLLLAGSSAQPDPRRENFYEVEDGHETYYIHVSPISGNVVLLARWAREPQDCCLSA